MLVLILSLMNSMISDITIFIIILLPAFPCTIFYSYEVQEQANCAMVGLKSGYLWLVRSGRGTKEPSGKESGNVILIWVLVIQ